MIRIKALERPVEAMSAVSNGLLPSRVAGGTVRLTAWGGAIRWGMELSCLGGMELSCLVDQRGVSVGCVR